MTDSHSAGKPLHPSSSALAASRKLDTLLASTIREGRIMPEVGATKLSGSIADIMAGVRAKMDEARLEVTAAASELVAEVSGYSDVAKALRKERDQVRADVDALLGNNPPAETDTTTEVKVTNGTGGG